MRRAIVVLMAAESLALGSLASCGSGGDSQGSKDASLPTDGPVAMDGYSATEGGADADATTALDGTSIEAGDEGRDSLVADETGDGTTEASEGAADVLSSLCPTECSDAADAACSTPSVAGNPPAPVGYQPLPQSQVTSAMTTWAVGILHDPATYPMFACTTETFGSLTVLARVEWLPPDFQTNVVHRGVVLYEQAD